MKVCHVTSAHNSDDVRIFKKECTSLAKNPENEVYIVGEGIGIKEVSGVQFIGCGDRPNSRRKRMLEFAVKVVDEAIKIDADIYHLHDPELLRYALRFKRNGKKVIFDSHENVLDSIDAKTYLPFIIRKAFKIYYNQLQKKVLPKVDGIVVVSPQMVDLYKEFNENIALVGNFPIIATQEESERANVVKGRFIFAGGISEQWSHKEIISAINEVEGCEYYIYGEGDPLYMEELRKLNKKNKVHFGGRLSFEEVQKEISKAQFAFAVLKPSKNSFGWEGTLGNTKLFEAMSKGKPVIATEFSLWKEIVVKNNCGVCVNPYESSDIKDKIIYLMEHPTETEQMGTNGKKLVRDKYSWNSQEKILFDFYNKLLGDE